MEFFLFITFLLLVGISNFDLIMSPHPDTHFLPTTVYLFLTGISIFIFIYYLIHFKIQKKVKFKKVELYLLLLFLYPIFTFFTSEISGLFYYFDFNATTLTPDYSKVKTLQSLYYGLSIPILIYSLVFLMDDIKRIATFYFFIYAVIFYVSLAIIFSFIFESSSYIYNAVNFINGGENEITSFTNSGNIYSFNLIMGFYALHFLYFCKINARNYLIIPIVFLLIVIFLTLSKTAIFSVIIFYFSYFVIRFSISKKSNLLKIIFLLVVFILPVSLFFQSNIFIFSGIFRLLSSRLISSLISRVPLWLDGFSLFLNSNYLFGLGFGLSNGYLRLNSSNIISLNDPFLFHDRFHNGFLEILVSYGLIGTLLLTIAHWEYFKALIQLTKRYWIAIPMWSLIISFAVQMMFEDRILFRPDLSGIFFMTMLILPLVKPEAFSNLVIENKTK